MRVSRCRIPFAFVVLPLLWLASLLVTHGPNLSAAFPEYSRNMTEGEALIFAPGGSAGPRLVQRIRIEDWARL